MYGVVVPVWKSVQLLIWHMDSLFVVSFVSCIMFYYESVENFLIILQMH